MGFDAGSPEMDLNSSFLDEHIDAIFHSLAEQSIARVIVEGSGGPDNTEITEDGLRFIRYILSISRSARFGFIPNFKDMDTIEELARQFVHHCGGPTKALQLMNKVTEITEN